MKNRFVRNGSYVYIILETKSGVYYEARISKKDFKKAKSFPGKWGAYINPKSRTVYAVGNSRKPDGKRCKIWLHRFLLDITDPKIDVDHKDHCGLHNERSNLRAVTHEQNLQNKNYSRNNKTCIRGVTIRKNGKFRAVVQSKGNTLLDKIVSSIEEAERLVKEKRKEVFPFAIEEDTLHPEKVRYALI